MSSGRVEDEVMGDAAAEQSVAPKQQQPPPEPSLSLSSSVSPSDVNDGCPGMGARDAGKNDACAGCPNQRICSAKSSDPAAATTPSPATDPSLAAIFERLSRVKHIVLVLSGKGGVGKSTFAAQMAHTLSSAPFDFDVGLLDLDICGPSVPTMFDVVGSDVHQSNNGWQPVYVEDNLGVMSIGFLLGDGCEDDAVVWRGPRKNGLIKQFLKDVDWGEELDYLIIDTPPGTSDEHISVAQLLMQSTRGVDGAIIITTPNEVSLADVRKEINFCEKVGIQLLGVVENMSNLHVPFKSLKLLQASSASAINNNSSHNHSNGYHSNNKVCNGHGGGNEDEVKDVSMQVYSALLAAGLDPLTLVADLDVFRATTGGAEAMAMRYNVPFLGKIPMDPLLCLAGETGKSFVRDLQNSSDPNRNSHAHNTTKNALRSIISKVVDTMRKETKY